MKTGTLVGGLIGIVSFIVFALLPSIVYGGYAGIILYSSIYGQLGGSNLTSRLFVAFGMLFGVLSVAAIFTVMGAALATGLVYGVRSFMGKEAREAEVERSTL